MDTTPRLTDPARLRSVRETGVGPRLDADLERFARLASAALGTPVALVSILEGDRQVFPGQVGLPEPWASDRQTPLSHSVCQHVTATAAPLVVADTRILELTRTSLAIPDLDVVAYAGMPLTDAEGEVFGALCAIDHEPRTWSPEELQVLTDLAEACSAELRLRIALRRVAAAHHELEEGRRRSELMLRAAVVLGDATGLSDLRQRLRDLVTEPLHPSYVGLSLVRDDGRVLRVPDPGQSDGLELRHATYSLDEAWPTSRCIGEQRTIVVAGTDQLAADGYAPRVLEEWRALGLQAATCLPLVGSQRVLGALTLGWDAPHAAALTEEAALRSVAAFAATAVERVGAIEQRITAATQLQRSMLSVPPAVEGLEIATLYRPAATADLVGGDWYDVHRLPAPADGSGPSPVVLTVGDITGHDMRAAAVMGQVRSMLRQAGSDRPEDGPAHAVLAVEAAARTLGLDATGTLVHGHLVPDTDGWTLTWANAGHPSPLVLAADGSRTVLRQGDVILHPDLRVEERHDHRVHLARGSVLLVHTDGLLDERRPDLDEMLDEVLTVLARLVHDERLPLDRAVEHLADELLGRRADDDVAILAVRLG
ncbi:GAF domain-containing SpoIIE family protein phosphatase [Nocardioides sp. ChNu-99]|uniref:GAF domain-containing SpoIIE family protein phosphatase n=1 Tax=Nocardioides sp. ChNu-99 TaxID=2839897 RepID=UPI002405D103|nr:GAF domain-containing SpoIIE family protein phosphatase [Nocardioides sp. ChNu-99]MDF9717821.1 SpoIIE family protein phosphatase [Nocardioides sp. ChNu-99]